MLHIAQFRELARDRNADVLPFPAEPPIDEQTIDFSGGPANVAIPPGTRFVRLYATQPCHFAITRNGEPPGYHNRALVARVPELVALPDEDRTFYLSARGA